MPGRALPKKPAGLDFAPLDTTSPIPLKDQISRRLSEAVRQGKLKQGDRIPAVRTLARHWAIGKSTVYDAIEELQNEGVLVIRPNSGTFVGRARKKIVHTGSVLGLVYHSPEQARHPYYASIIQAVEAEAAERGCQIKPITCLQDAAPVLEAIEKGWVQGCIYIFVTPFSRAVADKARTAGIPLVLIDHHDPALGCDSILIDNVNMFLDGTRHLISLGHSRIGCMLSDPKAMTSIERLAGYRTALTEAGLEAAPALEVNDEPGIDGGRRSMEALLPAGPTAIIAFNDEMAIGAIQAARMSGLKVPEDLSIIGAGDFAAFMKLDSSLSTMKIDTEEIGRVAVQRAHARINGLTENPRIFRANTWLAERKTTAPCSK